MKSLSDIAAVIKPSTTMAVDTEVRRLRAEGEKIFAFGGGEPDFMASPSVLQAGIRAIEQGQTKYTPAAGLPELRRAVADRLKVDYGLCYDINQIVVTCGGKYAIFSALQVLLNPGDEVILPAPYWVSYRDQIRMAGGIPVIVQTLEENRFKITGTQISAALTDKTKLLILNNPGNPSGSVYSQEELTDLASVCMEADLYVLSDEIYGKLIYTGKPFTSFPSLSTDAQSRTILVNGVSKAYAMTGWRIGYAAAPENIANAIATYVSQSTGCAPAMSQLASVEALSGSQEYVEMMRRDYEKRRDYLLARVHAIDGLSCIFPEGAFYLLICVESQYGRWLGGQLIQNDLDFSRALLDTAHVAVTPGTAFGLPGYIRWCYASSMEELKAGIDCLEIFLQEGT